AACATLGTARRLYCRDHWLNVPGWRRTARSWTVITSGTGQRKGPRNVGQWRTSSPRAARGRATGYHQASRAAAQTRPARPKLSRTRSGRCSRRCSTYRAVPARVWRRGETSIPTFTGRTVTLQERPSRLEPAEAPGVGEAAPDEVVPAAPGFLDRTRERVGIVRVGAERGVAARLVERAVRGRDDGHAARHRLDDRHAEALEARRVDEDLGSPVELREPVVLDVAEAALERDAAPTRAADGGERNAEALGRALRCREVLPRLERRDREQVRMAEVGSRARRAEALVDAGVRDVDAGRRHVEELGDLVLRELRGREDGVAGPSRVAVLRVVHPAGAALDPLGVPERDEVVDRRRADAAALGREHPVGEVEDVDGAEEALDGRTREEAPALPPEVREREEAEAQLDRDSLERPRDRAEALRARRSERDELVVAGGGFGEAAQRAADVVPDPGARVRQRRDVERDPQAPSLSSDGGDADQRRAEDRATRPGGASS